MCRVVDAVLVEDQRVSQGADLDQSVPVGGVTRESRDLEPQHDTGASHPDIGHELLETFPFDRGGTRLAEISIDNDDPIVWPAQRDRALAERILAFGTLGVLKHLPDRRLPDIQVGAALEVTGGDFLMRLDTHTLISCLAAMAMHASTRTMSA